MDQELRLANIAAGNKAEQQEWEQAGKNYDDYLAQWKLASHMPFSSPLSREEYEAQKNEEVRDYNGKKAVFDKKTKKFLRYE
jgi:hypothetical protein